MKYFIDAGTYNGKLLEEVICIFPPFDKYIGFEPVPQVYEESKARFKDNKKVEINQLAVSTSFEKNVKLYVSYCKEKGGSKEEGTEIGVGSTLCHKKKSGHIRKDKFIKVKTIDLSKYIMSNFKEEDYIVLKMDIEGKEYDVLEHMIKTGAIKYIDKLYCEWHVSRFKQNKNVTRDRHNRLVKKLRKLGIGIKGKSINDELSLVLRRLSEDE
jgi:FkbM family methyltransferase